MKTANTALSIGLVVVIALSVIALPATYYGIGMASAQTVLTMETSADDHGNKFFGYGLLQVVIEDSTTDDSLADDITVSIEVRDDTGSTLGTFSRVIDDTSAGSQRFEFFLANSTILDPVDPEGAGILMDINAAPVAGPPAGLNIGESLADGYTIKITYKTLSRTITYTDTPSSISTDREAYGSESLLFLTIDDQDGNVDPTNRDVITATTTLVTMDGSDSFAVVDCDETGDNSAEFECDYVLGTDIDMSTGSSTLGISVRDASQYMDDSNADQVIDGTDSAALIFETGTDDTSVTVEDGDGELTDPGAITFGGELKLHVTDTDRNISSKTEDDVTPDQGTFNPGVDDLADLVGAGAEGLVIYVDATGGDFEAVPMTEDADSSGIFVPDLANDELKVSFLANGETATDNNGILELSSADINEDIVIAYVDPADGDSIVSLTSSITKELTTAAGKISVDDTAGINSDFTLTITDADLNNNAKVKDIYTLNFTDFGGVVCDAPASCNANTEDNPNVEFGIFRGGHSLGHVTGDALYETLELQVSGVNIELLADFTESLTETGANTGVFTSSIDMQDILSNAENGDTVDDGDTLEFTLKDYMEDTVKSSSDELTVGRATAGVELSRDEAPIPPATTGPDTPIFDALGSGTVSVDIMVSDDDINENSGSQDTLTLDLVGAGQNFRVEVDAVGFNANSDDDGADLTGALDGNDLSDILTNAGGLDGLTLEETGANTGVFSETLTFVQGPISLDDWQDMRISFVYIQPDGDEDSAGVTFRGHDGVVDVDVPSVKSHTMMTVSVTDVDLNLDSTDTEEFDCGFAATELLRFEAENDDITQTGNCATFTETGEDTGVFTGQLEVGTDLTIVDGDDQSSNIHITYIDEVDSSGGSGDDIELDVPVVSGTGAILVKPDLVGPGTEMTVLVTDTDLDEKPSGKDTVDANVDTLEIKSDRREVGKTSADMEETGTSTGVFQFTIQLVTDASDCADDDLSPAKYDASNSGDKAEIGACPGDLIAIKYEDSHDASGRSAVVSKVVEISSWDPEFKADKDGYNVGDKATISIADPDANRDADIADTLRDIRITSTSDQVGEEISAIETGKDTGVFKLGFSLSGSATSGGIFVKKGDTVTVTYTDDFPANFVELENDKDFKFTLAVTGTSAGPTATTPSAPSVKDITGKVVPSLAIGQQGLLATTVINNLDQELSYVALIEVRDSSGVTVSIGFSTGTLASGARTEVGQSWTPDNSGNYQIRTFIISSLANPQILSAVQTSQINVS